MSRFVCLSRLAAALLAGGAVAGWTAAAAPVPAQPVAPSPSAAVNVYHFKRLIFADSLAHLETFHPGTAAGPVAVEGVAVLDTAEFRKAVLPYIGRDMTVSAFKQLREAVVAYVRRHDRPVVNILIPTQDISTGDFRLAVIIGRYSELKFRNNRYFSDELLESKLGVRPGDEIRLSVLESALAWANANPFRHVEAMVNSLNQEPGVADLDVAVEEHAPYRFGVIYDNEGNAAIGYDHFTGLAQFGNLWGLDHQASYEYSTSNDPSRYQVHAFDYRIPLPWRHYLVFDFSYALVRPSYYNGLLQEIGKSLVGDIHYIIPFVAGGWHFESSSGIDFKRSNNNLLYSGEGTVFSASTDVAEFNENFSGSHADRLGAWAFAANANYSPGGIDSADTGIAYATARTGAKADYVYGTLVLQRRFELPLGMQSFSKAIGQISSTNLLGSEELSVGGSATVRGYSELAYTGDQGVILSEEVQGPNWVWKVPFLSKKAAPTQNKLVAFVDYGRVYYKFPQPTDPPLPPLMGAGLGVRSSLATNFGLSFDFGWPLLQTIPASSRHPRGDVKVSFAY